MSKKKNRYTGIKGKFWKVFSEYIRKRDFYGYGKCISCGGVFESYKNGDAGHFIAAGKCGFGLLFSEKNVHLQCKRCNNPTWSPDAGVFYTKGLTDRYSKRYVDGILKKFEDSHFKGHIEKEWTKEEYQSKIEEYKKKIKQLDLGSYV